MAACCRHKNACIFVPVAAHLPAPASGPPTLLRPDCGSSSPYLTASHPTPRNQRPAAEDHDPRAAASARLLSAPSSPTSTMTKLIAFLVVNGRPYLSAQNKTLQFNYIVCPSVCKRRPRTVRPKHRSTQNQSWDSFWVISSNSAVDLCILRRPSRRFGNRDHAGSSAGAWQVLNPNKRGPATADFSLFRRLQRAPWGHARPWRASMVSPSSGGG